MLKNRKNGLRILVFVVAGILFCTFGMALADDIVDSIDEALQYYEEGDYAEAVSSLDYASQLIRQKRSDSLVAFLPKPLPEWTANDVTSEATGGAFFGGMISAKREYRKGQSSVTAEIAADSPVLQSMIMIFSNPAYATADGGRIKKIKRQKAIVKYDSSSQDGEINIVVANRYLVSIKGSNVSEQDLTDYAEAIDYGKLNKF